MSGVEHAEEDKLLKAYSQPNDPDLPQQWAMYKLGLFTDSPLVDGQSDMGAWNRCGLHAYNSLYGYILRIIDSRNVTPLLQSLLCLEAHVRQRCAGCCLLAMIS